MTMYIPPQKRDCPICEKEAIIEAVEMVPGQGILYRCKHIDGSTECEYSEYKDMDAVKTASKDRPSPELGCPECGKLGIVKAERDDSDKTKPDNWKYYISHPRGQCLVSKKEHRDIILKALGRYLEKEGEDHTKVKRRKYEHHHSILCPKCDQTGKPGMYKRNRLVVLHQVDNKTVWHSMTTEKEREIFLSLVHSSLINKKPVISKLRDTASVVSKKAHEMKCPVCNKIGRAGKILAGNPRLYIVHREDHKITSTHYMKTWEQKQLVANVLQLSSYNKAKLENQELRTENKLLRKLNAKLKAFAKGINDDAEAVLKEKWTA
jgi:hypothetical protein